VNVKKYCLDTGVFINAWNKHYPRPVFDRFWDHLSKLIIDGTAIVPREVYEDIERKEDGIFEWLKERAGLIRETNVDVELAQKAIMQHDDHCKLVKLKTGRSGSDPWVIAHAQIWDAVVVTEETPGGPTAKDPKIPDVCSALNVPCMRTVQMLLETDCHL
jgi:hypothetical protein